VTTPYATEAFLHQILGKALAAGASDVHLKVGQAPGARVHGDLVFFRGDKLRAEDTGAAARILFGADTRWEKATDVVGTYHKPPLGRFRVSAYGQAGSTSLVLRSIPLEIPPLASLGLPAAASSLVEAEHGLVLLAGGSGSGKSTTAAALVGHLNEGFPRHVVTFESPVEHLHQDRRGIVSQRMVGVDTPSVAEGLRASLRNDADVLYVADLADPAALEAAIDAAELGHLVLAAVAAPDIARAVARLSILGHAIPAYGARFSSVFKGGLAQRLLRKRDGSGLVPAYELLVATPAVREALRGGVEDGAALAAALGELMEKGASTHGMQSLEMHIKKLAADGVISLERGLGGLPHR
jgi:twitching motility protein PilT